MPMVKVWNDNIHPFETLFKGDKVRIAAGEYLEMDLYEAADFKGQYSPIMLDAGGQQDPKSYKKIRIEQLGQGHVIHSAESHVCMSCNHKSPSQEELEAHVKVRHASAMTLALPEEDAQIEFKKTRKGA